MVEKSSHLSMEELFAHNLRSEDKGLKNKSREIAAAFVVYREVRTENNTAKSASTCLGKLHIWVSKPLLEKYLRRLLAITQVNKLS